MKKPFTHRFYNIRINCFLNFRQNIYMDNPNLKYVIKFVDNVQEIELQNHNNYLRAKVALIFSKHTHTEC